MFSQQLPRQPQQPDTLRKITLKQHDPNTKITLATTLHECNKSSISYNLIIILNNKTIIINDFSTMILMIFPSLCPHTQQHSFSHTLLKQYLPTTTLMIFVIRGKLAHICP